MVTRLDHDGNIRPWLLAAERVGATVRWVDFDPATAELDLDQLEAVLTPRTRLVAVTGASNLLGTDPGSPADRRAGPPGRGAAVGGRRPPGRPRPRRSGCPRRRRRGLLAVQVLRSAPRGAGRRPRPAGRAAARQAAALQRCRARAVRARHVAVRAAGRDHGGRELPGGTGGGRGPTGSPHPSLRSAGRERARAAGRGWKTGCGSGAPRSTAGRLGGRRPCCSICRDGPPRDVSLGLAAQGVAAPAGQLLRDRGVATPRTRGPRCRPRRARPRTPTPATWTGCSTRSSSCPDSGMAQRGPAAAS